MNTKELLKELLPMIGDVKSFKKYVGDELNECYLGKLVDDGLMPSLACKDGGKTDLYYATYSNKNNTISIKFSIDVDSENNEILYINTNDVDIIVNGVLYDCLSF